MKRKHLDADDAELILTYAENDMKCKKTAAAMYLAYSTIFYRIHRIKEIAGLDPRRFYDLTKLVEMVKNDTGV